MGSIGRRRFLLGASALLTAPRIGHARKRLPVLGFLNPGREPARVNATRASFVGRLRELGWIEGKSIRFERVYSGNRLDRLPGLAAKLVAKKVDVIWTGSPWGAVAAARATSTIPIVFWRCGYPVEHGLVDSITEPGRNVTGLAWFAEEDIYVKRYQLLRELAPEAAKVCSIVVPATNRDVAGRRVEFTRLAGKIRAAVNDMRLEHRPVPVERLADFRRAFAEIDQWGADSLIPFDVPLTILARRKIIDFARRRRLVDVYEAREWAEAGGLMSYGIVFEPTLLRTAEMVDRILRGAKPAEIPVELPSRYELVVNLRSAKAQEFEVPQSILLRADRVIT